MHRKGKPSQYTWENVAIVPGGRAGLIRIAAVLNNAYVGFFIPDYTGIYSCLYFGLEQIVDREFSLQRNAVTLQERTNPPPLFKTP